MRPVKGDRLERGGGEPSTVHGGVGPGRRMIPLSCRSWKDIGWQGLSADQPPRRGGEPRLGVIMPAQIGRDELRTLTGQGAQLVEVLPAGDYDWAHLPGAVNLPLKELDARAGELDRSRPVIVYCHDWY